MEETPFGTDQKRVPRPRFNVAAEDADPPVIFSSTQGVFGKGDNPLKAEN